LIIVLVPLAILAVVLAIGLGVGLHRGGGSGSNGKDGGTAIANGPPGTVVTASVKMVNMNTPNKISGSWLVMLNTGFSAKSVAAQMSQISDSMNMSSVWRITSIYNSFSGLAMLCPEDFMMSTVITQPVMVKHVKFIEPDQTVSVDQIGSWGLDRIDQRDLPLDGSYSDQGINGAGVNVYVLDTGIRSTHTEFGGRVVPAFTAINDGLGTEDCLGHGTHVAGTIGSTTYGVAKGVTLHSVRVLSCNGNGSYCGILDGINWVTENFVPPAVASMSLGGQLYEMGNIAILKSINKGVTYVVAAGNDAQDACQQFPAAIPQGHHCGSNHHH